MQTIIIFCKYFQPYGARNIHRNLDVYGRYRRFPFIRKVSKKTEKSEVGISRRNAPSCPFKSHTLIFFVGRLNISKSHVALIVFVRFVEFSRARQREERADRKREREREKRIYMLSSVFGWCYVARDKKRKKEFL